MLRESNVVGGGQGKEGDRVGVEVVEEGAVGLVTVCERRGISERRERTGGIGRTQRL